MFGGLDTSKKKYATLFKKKVHLHFLGVSFRSRRKATSLPPTQCFVLLKAIQTLSNPTRLGQVKTVQ